jgi:hypothetical protein
MFADRVFQKRADYIRLNVKIGAGAIAGGKKRLEMGPGEPAPGEGELLDCSGNP